MHKSSGTSTQLETTSIPKNRYEGAFFAVATSTSEKEHVVAHDHGIRRLRFSSEKMLLTRKNDEGKSLSAQ